MASVGLTRRMEPIAALDVGGAKACCLIAERGTDGGLDIVGAGVQACAGLRSGAIVDLEATETAIVNAVHDAETEAGVGVERVVVNVSAGRPSSQIVAVEVPLAERRVAEEDVRYALEAGCDADDVPGAAQGRELIHTIPIAYAVDDVKGVRDPRGMFGDLLGVNMHVVTAQANAVRTLAAALERCRLDVEMLCVSPIAAGLGALVDDEMELGCAVIDLGAGVTSIAVFFDGQAVWCDSIPLGGGHITADLARGLCVPLAQAERLKTLHGGALSAAEDAADAVAAPGLGEEDGDDRRISRAQLIEIIEPRLAEIFDAVSAKMSDAGFEDVSGRRVVLTGGGAQLSGVREYAARALNKEARIGRPLAKGQMGGRGPLRGLDAALSGPDVTAA
ncbi:MAG: cell division protein FtsA, partial [Pseudomonadota bacterium]